MATLPDLPKDRLELLAEYHDRTWRLCHWAVDISGCLSEADPDWSRVQNLFQIYHDLHEWLVGHRESLATFSLCRPDAIEWCGEGWQNWHATVAGPLVHKAPRNGLSVWIGSRGEQAEGVCPSFCIGLAKRGLAKEGPAARRPAAGGRFLTRYSVVHLTGDGR